MQAIKETPFRGEPAEMLASPEVATLLERVRRRAQELNIPFEAALKQAFMLYLKDGLPVVRAHGG